MTNIISTEINSHSYGEGVEREYDRLRDLARHERGQRDSYLSRSREAYSQHNGALAHQLSEDGKRHGQLMEQYNRQASEYIFRENNAGDRVAADTIDLHGQFVQEAEAILEQRIRYARDHNQTHLHV